MTNPARPSLWRDPDLWLRRKLLVARGVRDGLTPRQAALFIDRVVLATGGGLDGDNAVAHALQHPELEHLAPGTHDRFQ